MVFKDVKAYTNGRLKPCGIFVSDNGIATISEASGAKLFEFSLNSDIGVPFFDNTADLIIIPGFSDVHVHLREPGFSYKETIVSGTLAAASAGYTALCTMPNLNPVPDSLETLEKQLELIRSDAIVTVLPFGAITKGQKGIELSDMEEMADKVIGFSDDGKGVQNDELMLEAMKIAKKLGKPIAAHCEDDSLLHGGVIHDGVYAKKHGIPGISSESEFMAIKRDLALVEKTGCAYHVCHISAAESVELIRQAKARGLPVSCETAPHYLTLCDEDLIDEGRFKMNPPIRSKRDRDALLEGICDGTIDVIATDHAPHSAEEKARGLRGSAMGITGLECAFPVLYTSLVKKKIISLEKLISLMSTAPDTLFGIRKTNDFAAIDLAAKYSINPDNFHSKGHATPFAHWEVFGRNLMTVKDGKEIWRLTGK